MATTAALTTHEPPRLVRVGTHGQTAKIRKPWATGVLSLLTLGLYYLVWYYKVNRELCDYGEGHQTDLGYSAVTSLLAVTLGMFLFGIPPLVSIFHTGQRTMGAQRVAGVRGASAIVFLLISWLPILSLLFSSWYLQAQLNKAWLAATRTGRVAVAP